MRPVFMTFGTCGGVRITAAGCEWDGHAGSHGAAAGGEFFDQVASFPGVLTHRLALIAARQAARATASCAALSSGS